QPQKKQQPAQEADAVKTDRVGRGEPKVDPAPHQTFAHRGLAIRVHIVHRVRLAHRETSPKLATISSVAPGGRSGWTSTRGGIGLRLRRTISTVAASCLRPR